MSKKLSEKKWWHTIALASAVIATLPLTSYAQDTGEEDLEELETFTMVGSRIKRIDAAPISPVLQFSSDDIENSGYNTIGDALRALPFNNGQSLTPTDSGTSFTPGVSTMNLRGLGNNNTLILINGRRGAPYAAPGFNGFQTVFDINSIPDGAIDSVNIEKDGASAIYGSDAVAGVVDFVLRSDYEGLSTSIKLGNYIDTDGLYRSASLVYGTSTAKDSIIAAFSYAKQEHVYSRDLDYTDDTDNSAMDISNAHWEFSDPDVAAAAGLTTDDLVAAMGDPITDGWFDQSSSMGIPGFVIYGDSYITVGESTSNPTIDDAVGGYHTYNYLQDSTLFPEFEKYSLYTRLKHDISDKLYTFVEISYSRIDSVVDSAPTPVSMSSEHGLTPDSSMYIPAENPYNFIGEDIYTAYRRLVETGNRYNEVTSEAPRFLAGIGGKLGGDWDWEVGAMHAASEVSQDSFVVTDNKLQEALLGLTRQNNGDLVYDASTAADDRVYFNWFGVNGDDIVDYLSDINSTSAEYILESIDFKASGTIVELPAGPLGLAVGGEYRKESLDVNKSYLNETGMIIGGGTGTSSEGNRNIKSIYSELNIPATKWLEFQLAGRWESYSDDGYGDEIRPKVGVKIKPLDWLSIRASYGKSFKAPDLAYLYTSSQASFSSGNVTDPITGESKQLQIITGGNPDLEPETTDSYYVGFQIEPSGVLEGLTISFDYIRYESENLLTQLSDLYGYSEFLTKAAMGDETFVNKVVRDGAGNLMYILDDYMNLSESTHVSYDLDVRYRYETEKLGTFSTGLYVTYLDSYEIDGDEYAGSRLNPEWRGNLSFGWKKGDWSANVFVNYIGGRDHISAYSYYLDNPTSWAYMGADTYGVLYYDIDAQIIVNPSISYSGLWNSTITLGVNNVFNSNPPVDPVDGLAFTSGVNSGEPFFWYLSWEKEF